MKRLYMIAMVGTVLCLLGGGARGALLVDQLWIVDTYAYDQGAFGSVIGGWSLMGGTSYDTQVVDDFLVPDPGYIVTDVWFDYLCIVGGGSPPWSLIEVFADNGSGRPAETPVAHAIVSTTSTSWTPIVYGYKGERHHASGLSIELSAGRYWIGMQPITLQGGEWVGNGDIYFAVQHTATSPAVESFYREGGIVPAVNHDGSLGFGPLPGARIVPTFNPLSELELFAGDTSLRVDGMPIPVSDVLGDFNGDGALSGLDIPGFKSALADPDGWASANPDRPHPNVLGDFNADGGFSGLDIPGFKMALASGAVAVPEPGTLALGALGGLTLLGKSRRKRFRNLFLPAFVTPC